MSDDREIRAYYELGREAGRLTDWGRVEAEPSLLGASPHVLAIATRP